MKIIFSGCIQKSKTRISSNSAGLALGFGGSILPSHRRGDLTASVGYEGRLKINDHFTTSTRLAWQKDLKKNDAQVSAHMTSLGGMAYSVPGPQFDRDYLMLTTSARTKLGGIDLFAGLNSTLMRKGGLNTTVFVNVGRNF